MPEPIGTRAISGVDPAELLAPMREAAEALSERGFEVEWQELSSYPALSLGPTPDGVPGIGEIAAVPGFILAAGFSGHDCGIGPGAGHLIADIVTGDEPIVDPRVPSGPLPKICLG